MVRYPTLAVAAAVLAISGCRQAPTNPPDRRSFDVRSIRDFESDWNRDFNRNDVERLLSRYTLDATLQLPNTAPANGSEAIRAVWKAAVEDGNFSLQLDNQHVEVARSGDIAYSQGSYTATHTDPATAKQLRETGSYAVLYRRANGNAWKAVSEIHSVGAVTEVQ